MTTIASPVESPSEAPARTRNLPPVGVGGARAGAGRPKSLKERVFLQLHVEKDNEQQIERFGRRNNILNPNGTVNNSAAARVLLYECERIGLIDSVVGTTSTSKPSPAPEPEPVPTRRKKR